MPGNLPAPHTNPLFPDVPDVPTISVFQGLTDHFDIYRPQGKCRCEVGSTPTAGKNSLAGRKGTFDGRYGCRKCFCVTFDKSNKTALTGMNTIYVLYLALFRECEVKK